MSITDKDRRLLRRAAKAMGYRMGTEWDCSFDGIFLGLGIGDDPMWVWDPLNDSADAFNLAIDIQEKTGAVVCISIGKDRTGCEFHFANGPDSSANTKRAIVMAAVALSAKDTP